MKGLVIWADSYCRSTFAFYQGLGQAFQTSVEIYLFKKSSGLRTKVGFSNQEFDGMYIQYLDNVDQGTEILNKRTDWCQLFGQYQKSSIHQKLILKAKERGCKIAIASEAPCNMESYPRRILKSFYLSWILPRLVKPYIEASSFVLNYSGDDTNGMKRNGWPESKIVACGYYSPMLAGSHLTRRGKEHWEKFTILLSGIHQYHRSPMLLLKALRILDKRGINYQCYITQDGPLLPQMKEYAAKHQMKTVHFLGFVPMDELIRLYETCSVFVGTGNCEPWGMRLNDVLQCGTPLIVNRGMGGAKLVDDYGCGLVFKKGDSTDLADALARMIKDESVYRLVSERAYKAATLISPLSKAAEIATIIRHNYPDWCL